MAYDSLVLDEFKKYSGLGVNITQKLNEIAQTEYMNWLNGNLNISRIRDLHIWRFSQLMEHIFQFKQPTEESLAFIFQITVSSARSLIKDYRAQYGRKGFRKTLRDSVASILWDEWWQNLGNRSFIVPFQNDSQIDVLFEAVRRVAENDSTIEEPQKVPQKIYMIEIGVTTAQKAIVELLDTVLNILNTVFQRAKGNGLTTFKVPFKNQSQIDELSEAVRRAQIKNPNIVSPNLVPDMPYVIEIDDDTAEKALDELRLQPWT